MEKPWNENVWAEDLLKYSGGFRFGLWGGGFLAFQSLVFWMNNQLLRSTNGHFPKPFLKLDNKQTVDFSDYAYFTLHSEANIILLTVVICIFSLTMSNIKKWLIDHEV